MYDYLEYHWFSLLYDDFLFVIKLGGPHVVRFISNLILCLFLCNNGENEEKSIKKIGRHFENQRKNGEWVLKSWQSLTMQYWPNRYENLFMIKIHYFIVFLSKNTLPIVLFLKQNNLRVHFLGKAFWRQEKLLLWVQNGRWAMDKLFGSSNIVG